MSHANCIFPMNRYLSKQDTKSACEDCLVDHKQCNDLCNKNYYEKHDKLKKCEVCNKDTSPGTDYWYQGVMHRICIDHDPAAVLLPSPGESRAVRVCPGNCPDGSIQCVWPLT